MEQTEYFFGRGIPSTSKYHEKFYQENHADVMQHLTGRLPLYD
jgi:hypothetical protein